MKIVIDHRPATNNHPDVTFVLRLYPETNEEMGNMEWGIACGMTPVEIIRVSNEGFHYAIVFREKERV